MTNKLIRLLFILGAVIGGLMVIYGVTRIIGDISSGLKVVGTNISTEFIFLLFTIFCLLGYKRAKEDEIEKKNPGMKERRERDTLIDRDLKIIDAALNHREAETNKSITKNLRRIKNLLLKIKEKDYQIDEYLLVALEKVVTEYREIIHSAFRNTDKGKVFLTKISNTLEILLKAINDTYTLTKENKKVDVEKEINTLKESLVLDHKAQSAFLFGRKKKKSIFEK